MGFKFLAGWGFAAVVLLCRILPAQTAAHPDVRVLVIDNAKLSAGVIEKAGWDAARIFRAAGIPLTWINCFGRSVPSECRVDPHGTQFVLQIVPKGKTACDFVYGEAFVGEDGKGRYADVFFDRVQEAHRQAGVDVIQLLSAVSVHEIGHLLLGLDAHSWMGIMAPAWKLETLRLIDMGQIFFTSDQALRMREGMRGDDITVSDVGASGRRAVLILP